MFYSLNVSEYFETFNLRRAFSNMLFFSPELYQGIYLKQKTVHVLGCSVFCSFIGHFENEESKDFYPFPF